MTEKVGRALETEEHWVDEDRFLAWFPEPKLLPGISPNRCLNPQVRSRK